MVEHAPLRRFGAGLLLGLMAEQTVLFAVPLMVYQATGSLRYSGLVFALEWLPALLAYPFAGVLADRVGGRTLLQWANVLRAASLALTVLCCSLAPALTVWALAANGVLLSLLMAPVRMAVERTVPQVAPAERLAHTQSLVQNMELLAQVLGPACAAALVLYSGKLALLGLAAAALLLAALCWHGLPDTHANSARQPVLGALRQGWQLLLGNPPIVSLALLNFSINLAFACVLSANAFVVSGVFQAADGAFGLINSAAGALGLLNFLLVPWLLKRLSIHQLGALGFAVLCGGILAMGLANGVLAYGASFVLAMAGCTLFNVFNRTQRIKVIPREHLGKVMGPFYLLNLASYPLGGLLSASIGQRYGIQGLILALSLLLCMPGALLFHLTTRRLNAALGTDNPAMEASR